MAEQNETTPGGLKKLWTKRETLKFMEEQLRSPVLRQGTREKILNHYISLRKWDQPPKRRKKTPRQGIKEKHPDIFEMARREATNGREV